jgi:hypothetical protein
MFKHNFFNSMSNASETLKNSEFLVFHYDENAVCGLLCCETFSLIGVALSGLMVSVLAIGTNICGFKPSQE